MGQLKSTLYARMEEVSFRAGAAVAGGVLTAAGVAIALALLVESFTRDVAWQWRHAPHPDPVTSLADR